MRRLLLASSILLLSSSAMAQCSGRSCGTVPPTWQGHYYQPPVQAGQPSVGPPPVAYLPGQPRMVGLPTYVYQPSSPCGPNGCSVRRAPFGFFRRGR
jgi:hypothetical protein